MIYVTRDKPQTPILYFTDEWKHYKQTAEDFFSLSKGEHKQSRFEFEDLDKLRDVKEALIREFHGKCAYSEAPIDPKNCRIIRHRPESGASDLGRSGDRDHYWWFAYTWENLIPVLPQCARAKGNFFPVNGVRSDKKMSLEESRSEEQALLPDPCVPQPSKKLRFNEDGRVETKSPNHYDHVIPEILGLNSSRLMQARRQAIRELNRTTKLTPQSILRRHFQTTAPFLELKFQWLEKLLKNSSTYDSLRWVALLKNLTNEYPLHRVKEAIKTIQTPKAPVTAKSTTQGRVSPKPAITRPIRLTKIEIKNFKCIENLTLDLPQPNDLESPNGLMILGENGSGKSSILQAVALALEDPVKLKDHPFLTHTKVLRRGEYKGYVRLHLLDQTEPIEVSFSRSKFSFNGPRDHLSFYLSAYGAHRIIPRHDDKSPVKAAPVISINNLWDPYESLIDAERWMLTLDNKDFDAFALALKDLLDLRSDGLIYKKGGKLYFNIGGDKQSLEDLSTGYQSIIATATDIIASYPIKGIDMHHATGIVMIDEIGAHLHPRWRMRIVQAYRRAFKRLQFLCTTHEPLCLRGTRQEEVVVLQQGEESVRRITDLPDLEEMRIDQILTSPIFGMKTTVDPEAERKFQEYYYLLAKKKLTAPEKERCEDLKQYLYRYGVLGADRRSRAIYDIIDKDLATQGPETQTKGVSAKTRNKVLKIWKNTSFDF